MAAAPVGFAGVLGANYSNTSCSGCGSANGWGLNGQGAFGLGMSDLGAEIDGGVAGSFESGGGTSAGVGGNIFWAPAQGRLGATVDWNHISIPGPDGDVTSYGGFGEFYASNQFTLGGNAGGLHLSSSGASVNGMYLNGGGTLYAMPDLGITGSIGYNHIGKGFGNVMTYSIGGEWLVSETTPISLSAGYTNVDLPHGAPSLNVFTLGVKFYAGGGAMSLVDRHRNGALGPLTQPILTGLRSVF